MHISDAEREAIYRNIYLRRDVRSDFRSDPIPDDVLMRILDAAHHAPSVGFMQPWDFIVVKSKEVRGQIKAGFEQANREAAQLFTGERREKYRSLKLEGIMESALGVCVTCDRQRTGQVVLGKTANPEMDIYSTVCAVHTIWLAARAENIGVGWVSIIHDEVLKEVLHIPEHIVPIAYLCMGYTTRFNDTPDLERKQWQSRLPLEPLLHYDEW
ncbi:MAG: 5,6-dimethylbenzimidazole synthase [Chloroflexota bacterium]